jgi:transportin-1
MSSTNKEVALYSSEFWRLLSEYDQIAVDCVTPHLRPLISILLINMKYGEEELTEIGCITEDAHIPDSLSSYNTVYGIGQDDDDEDNQGWNVRRCSSQALDFICRPFNKGFFEVFMPLVQAGLQSQDWAFLEASLMGLGCISIGQYHAIKPSLGSMIQYLFDLTAHDNPLIRSCSCWVLSRYNKWILYHRDNNTNYFNKLVEILLTRVKDKNKEVQKTACIALADICDESLDHIKPYSESILVIFSDAFKYFQKKNLQLLMRSIGAVARALGSTFADKKYVDVIVPPMLKCWNEVADDSPDIFPIFDCFLHIARAMGKQFAPYATPIFQRCLKLIETYLKELDHAMRTNDEPPDNSFAILPIDMLSGLLRSIGSDLGGLIDQSNFMYLLVEVLKNVDYYVDQSKFALIGDMARFVPDRLYPLVNDVFPILLTGTNSMCQYIDTTHNALWAIGEMAVAFSKEKNLQNPPDFLSPFLEETLKRAFYILSSPEADDLTETAAVLLGRIAWVCPRVLIDSQYQLKEILKPFCISLRNLGDGIEKTEALKGFLCVIQSKVELITGQGDLSMVLDLVLNWHGRDEELVNTIGTFLHFIKGQLGPQQWDGLTSVFPNFVKTRIVDFYKC